MDPSATYELFLVGVRDNETAEILEHGRNLLQWVNRGGFMPRQCSDRGQLKAQLREAIARVREGRK